MEGLFKGSEFTANTVRGRPLIDTKVVKRSIKRYQLGRCHVSIRLQNEEEAYST